MCNLFYITNPIIKNDLCICYTPTEKKIIIYIFYIVECLSNDISKIAIQPHISPIVDCIDTS